MIGDALNLGQVASFYTKYVTKGAFFVSLRTFPFNAREIRTDIGTPMERVWVTGIVKVEDSLGLEVNTRVLLSYLKATAPDTFGFGLNLVRMICGCTGACWFCGKVKTPGCQDERKADNSGIWNIEGNQTLRILGHVLDDNCGFVQECEVQLRTWTARFEDGNVLNVSHKLSQVQVDGALVLVKGEIKEEQHSW